MTRNRWKKLRGSYSMDFRQERQRAAPPLKTKKGTRLAAGPLKGKKSYSTPFLREAVSLTQRGTCWLSPPCFAVSRWFALVRVALRGEKVLHPGMRPTVAGRLKTYRILRTGPEID